MIGHPLDWEESDVALASGKTRTLSRGDGPLLIWTHSLFHPIDVEAHTPLGPMLDALTGHRIIRYDARGQGRSEAGAGDVAHRWDRLGADLVELAGWAGQGPYVLAGASMGAVASIYAALSGAIAISRLVLVIPPTAWETRPQQAKMYRAILSLLERLGLPAVVRTFEQYLNDKTVVPGFEGAREHVLENLRRYDPGTLAMQLRASAASDLPPRERLSALAMPALIVAVGADLGHPRSTAETLARVLPHASLEIHERISSQRLTDSVQRFLR